jgi:hypothetical protein
MARLCEDVMPTSFDKVTYEVFFKASWGIIRAGLHEEDVCQLAKAVITFSHEAKELPQASLALCASAMHARIGTKDVEPTPTPAVSNGDERLDLELFNKIRKFLPKAGKQPEWLAPWKVVLDAKKAEDDTTKAEEAAKKEEVDKADAEAAARLLDAAGILAAGIAATGDADGTPAPGVGAGSSDDFSPGQIVSFKSNRKEIKGTIDIVQTKHCWLVIMPDQGADSGVRKRVLSKSLRVHESSPVPTAPVATPESATPPATSAESSEPPATSVASIVPPATSPPPQASTSTVDVAEGKEQEEKEARELAKEKAAWGDMFDMFGEGDPLIVEPQADED